MMIADARGILKPMATTHEDAAFAELLQMQSGLGPCMDCYRTAEAVSVPDIAAEHERWPRLPTAMTELGYGSLQAIPVRLHDRGLGALTPAQAHGKPARKRCGPGSGPRRLREPGPDALVDRARPQ
ncbi:GAF domain-containing protein [Streptomyces sp. NPDC005017]|uniref:GAF domain-containing protein n=1 Tax=Streptomyces sp. NPDC005017 TaxID=3364706 RepID=UPI0036C223E4